MQSGYRIRKTNNYFVHKQWLRSEKATCQDSAAVITPQMYLLDKIGQLEINLNPDHIISRVRIVTISRVSPTGALRLNQPLILPLSHTQP